MSGPLATAGRLRIDAIRRFAADWLWFGMFITLLARQGKNMSSWGFWDWLTYCGVGLAALIIGVDTGFAQAEKLKRFRLLDKSMWGFLPLALMAISACSLAYSQFFGSPHHEKPLATLSYANDAAHIHDVSNSTDPKANRTIIFLDVKSTRRIAKVTPLLTYIGPKGRSSSAALIDSNSSSQHMTLGWYGGAGGTPAWEPRSIPKDDRFVAFNILDNGTRLDLFTNSQAFEQDAFFHNIPVGTYVVEFQIDSESLDEAVYQRFEMNWLGHTGGFTMTACIAC